MVKAISKKRCWQGPGDMAQWLRVCLALTGDGVRFLAPMLGDSNFRESRENWTPWSLRASARTCTYTHTYKVHKTKKEISFKRTVGKNTLLEDYKARVALGNILSHLKAKIPFDWALKNNVFIYVYVYLSVWMFAMCLGAHGGKRTVLDPLKVGF